MITYNKTYNQNVLDNVEQLMRQEFRNVPVRYDNLYRGTSFFRLTPQRDDILELRSDGAIREYSILLTYCEKERGIYGKKRSLDTRIDIIERLKEMFRTNIASVDDIAFFVDSSGKNLITSDSEEFTILKRPLLITSNDSFFITSDNKAFTVYPPDFEYNWHNTRLQSVNYELESENPNYLAASVEFRCVVEEVYSA